MQYFFDQMTSCYVKDYRGTAGPNENQRLKFGIFHLVVLLLFLLINIVEYYQLSSRVAPSKLQVCVVERCL